MPTSLVDLLPTAADVLAISKEELAAYILESLNSRPELASGERSENIRNFMRGVDGWYHNGDVTARANSAWRWLVDQEFLSPDTRDINEGWFVLTNKGRTIRKHDDLQVPRVPRAANPGPPPDFSPVTTDGLMKKHLHVLWEEAVMATNGHAYLLALIGLGSLLEGALLAKCMSDVATAHAAPSAPRRKGAVVSWEWWGLDDFIKVAGECGWIHQTRTAFSDHLRNYRNFVHPYRAYQVGYRADQGLVGICWEVVRAALRDLGIALA